MTKSIFSNLIKNNLGINIIINNIKSIQNINPNILDQNDEEWLNQVINSVTFNKIPRSNFRKIFKGIKFVIQKISIHLFLNLTKFQSQREINSFKISLEKTYNLNFRIFTLKRRHMGILFRMLYLTKFSNSSIIEIDQYKTFLIDQDKISNPKNNP